MFVSLHDVQPRIVALCHLSSLDVKLEHDARIALAGIDAATENAAEANQEAAAAEQAKQEFPKSFSTILWYK